ncbi:SP51 protein, partial [Ardeotis kori]|nr:SP51 protein [Ardeotis kori]
TCKMRDGRPSCVHIGPTCQDVQCRKGSTCQMVKDWPRCVQIKTFIMTPDCSDVQCPKGTKCKIINEQPRCVYSPPSCRDLQCQVGTTCQIINGWPQCIQIKTSIMTPTCSHVQCPK